MGISDRIILTLYTFLMAVVSILVILCSLDVFSQKNIIAFIANIPGNWLYAVGGVILLVVSLRLLITGLGFTGDNSLKIIDCENGKVHVGKSAIENYIAELAQEIYGIHNVKVIAKLGSDGIYVRINSSIEPGINIPETTGEVKANIKEGIKKVTGIEVKDIEIFFKQIKSKED